MPSSHKYMGGKDHSPEWYWEREVAEANTLTDKSQKCLIKYSRARG